MIAHEKMEKSSATSVLMEESCTTTYATEVVLVAHIEVDQVALNAIHHVLHANRKINAYHAIKDTYLTMINALKHAQLEPIKKAQSASTAMKSATIVIKTNATHAKKDLAYMVTNALIDVQIK